jgi:phosphoglycolate phosphatase
VKHEAVLLTDLDNTIFSWIDYFGPSLRAMVGAVRDQTNVEEDEIYRQLRDVYCKYSAAEHPHAVYETALCRGMDPDLRAVVARRGEEAFDVARRSHLKAYPHVRSTLTALKERDVLVVGVTSSSVYDAVTRIELLRLDPLFDGVVAWEGIPGIRVVGATNLRERVIPVPGDSLKPSSYPYQLALEWCGVDPGTPVWVVGDSVANDLAPGRNIGASTVWARYGHDYDAANFETVLQVTFWDDKKIKSSYNASAITPDRVIDSFGDLIKLIAGKDDVIGAAHENLILRAALAADGREVMEGATW